MFVTRLKMLKAFMGLCFFYFCSSFVIYMFDGLSSHKHSPKANYLLPEKVGEMPMEQQKVWIVSTGRSGSSFLVTILLQHRQTQMVFEPFNKIQRDLKLQGEIDINTFDGELDVKYSDLMNYHLEGFLNCHHDVYESYHSGKPYGLVFIGLNRDRLAHQDNCSTSNPLIVKTIRFRRKHLRGSWLQNSNIKVIHLIRDPRARYNSMKEASFSLGLKNFRNACISMTDDLKLGDILPRDRYLLMKYEELAQHPFKVAQMLYKFLGLQYTKRVEYGIKYHTGQTNATLAVPSQSVYTFGTLRNKTFQFDHWKKDLSREEILEAEENCAEFMRIANYRKFPRENLVHGKR